MTSAPLYDRISHAYQQSESVSVGKNRIKNRFSSFLQVSRPSSVLDLGCGSGVFAQIAKDAEVKIVLGVDISPLQIEIARGQSSASIKYLVQDISNLAVTGQFDMVSSVFGFCYALSLSVLRKQLKAAYDHLADGGSMFAVVCHPDHPTSDSGESYRVFAASGLKDGMKLHCDFILNSKVIASDEKFYWSKPTWEKVLADVGFRAINWEELSDGSTNIVLTVKK